MKLLKLSLITSLAVVVAGCSYTNYNSKYQKRIIQDTTLANGKVARIGAAPVEPAWECLQVAQKTYTFEMLKLRSSAGIGGVQGEANKQAIAFANQPENAKKNFNYIYVFIPNQVSGFTEFKHGYYNLYNCKYPPTTNSDPFKVDAQKNSAPGTDS